MDAILIDCYPDTKIKKNILKSCVKSFRKTNLPIVLVSHLFVEEDVDYFIYDKNNALSENYNIFYHFDAPDYVKIRTARNAPYHSLSCLRSIKNGASFQKFDKMHFFEADALIDTGYVDFASQLLDKHKFVGVEYRVDAQSLAGIVTNFFSFDRKWLDESIPDIDNWDDFAALGQGKWDYLLFENWMHNYFDTHQMLEDCYFMTPAECEKYIIDANIEVPGGREPGIRVWLSETKEDAVIVFIHLYGGKIPVNMMVDCNGYTENITLHPGILYWQTMEKKGRVLVKTKFQHQKFDIIPDKDYSVDTTFKFNDDRIICRREWKEYGI